MFSWRRSVGGAGIAGQPDATKCRIGGPNCKLDARFGEDDDRDPHRGSGLAGVAIGVRDVAGEGEPATKIATAPSRHEKNSRVPGRCGVPAITAPGAKCILSSISSGTGSGTSGRSDTPRPCDRDGRSAASHLRTLARGEASSSSIGTPSLVATFTSTASDGLPSPDSRLAMVERGNPDDLASASCVRPRAWRSPTRLRARCAAMRSGLSIWVTFRQRIGHRLEDS